MLDYLGAFDLAGIISLCFLTVGDPQGTGIDRCSFPTQTIFFQSEDFLFSSKQHYCGPQQAQRLQTGQSFIAATSNNDHELTSA